MNAMVSRLHAARLRSSAVPSRPRGPWGRPQSWSNRMGKIMFDPPKKGTTWSSRKKNSDFLDQEMILKMNILLAIPWLFGGGHLATYVFWTYPKAESVCPLVWFQWINTWSGNRW
jgi:hypothetical protein